MNSRFVETVPFKAKFFRSVALGLTNPLVARTLRMAYPVPDLGQKVEPLSEESLPRMTELLKAGYPAVIFFTHFSEKDIPAVLKFGFQQPYLKDRRYLFPVALHQVKSSITAGARRLGIESCSVVTESTLEYAELNPEFKAKHEKEMERDGMGALLRYATRATEIARVGGAIWVAPQSRREEKLITHTKAAKIIINKLTRADIDAAIIYLALELEGEQNYDSSGLNLGRRYILRLGRVETIIELLARAKEGNVDFNSLIRQELESISPPAYLVKANS